MNNNRLYKRRTLSENLNMVFDFVGENWRKWFKMMIYYLLPFSVLLGTTVATFHDDSSESMSSTAYGISIVLFIIGCALVTALQILLVKWHENHNGTLDGCDTVSMWKMMPKASLKCLGIILLWTPLLALSFLSIILPIIGFVVVFAMLPIFLLCPIMLLESNNSLSGMSKRAFSLGYKKWGTLILIAVVMVLVSVLINNAVTFPIGIFMAVETFLEESDSVMWAFSLDVMRYILCVAECFMIFVEIGLLVLAMTFHYGSVATEVEDIGLEQDIDNFSQLK